MQNDVKHHMIAVKPRENTNSHHGNAANAALQYYAERRNIIHFS